MSFAPRNAMASPKVKPTSPAPRTWPPGPIGNQAELRRLSPAPRGLQPKLEIGAVDDPLEREADEVADKVMRMPDPAPSLRSPPQVSRKCAACEEEEKKKVQRKPADNIAKPERTPPSVTKAIAPSGRPLDTANRAFFEPRFGYDLSRVRLHDDVNAARSTHEIGALGYTVGSHVVLRHRQDGPSHLLAHELAHVEQQSASDRSPADRRAILRMTPAAPAGATYDRTKIAIGEIDDLKALSAGASLAADTRTATIAVGAPDVVSIAWQLFTPADQVVQSVATLPNDPGALTTPFVVDPNNFVAAGGQGRYLLRCSGLNAAHREVVYSDRSFFVWTSLPESKQGAAALKAIEAAPTTHSLGEVGAAEARSKMLEHQASLASGGPGTIQGNRCGLPTPGGVSPEDCTTYVLEVLGDAFKAKGRDADWKKIMSIARRKSGGRLKGTEVLKALESVAGWKAVFWSPDPRNPDDSHSEHPEAYKKVQQTGKYYGVTVDNANSVVDYRRTSSTAQETWTKLDKLKQVPLGVIAARGGDHMTLILNGEVYEVHWDLPATDPNVLQATPLEKWIWNSGVIVMPAEDFARAF